MVKKNADLLETVFCHSESHLGHLAKLPKIVNRRTNERSNRDDKNEFKNILKTKVDVFFGEAREEDYPLFLGTLLLIYLVWLLIVRCYIADSLLFGNLDL